MHPTVRGPASATVTPLPESGLPESGLPESGLPESGLPESGLPEFGPSASGWGGEFGLLPHEARFMR